MFNVSCDIIEEHYSGEKETKIKSFHKNTMSVTQMNIYVVKI